MIFSCRSGRGALFVGAVRFGQVADAARRSSTAASCRGSLSSNSVGYFFRKAAQLEQSVTIRSNLSSLEQSEVLRGQFPGGRPVPVGQRRQAAATVLQHLDGPAQPAQHVQGGAGRFGAHDVRAATDEVADSLLAFTLDRRASRGLRETPSGESARRSLRRGGKSRPKIRSSPNARATFERPVFLPNAAARAASRRRLG